MFSRCLLWMILFAGMNALKAQQATFRMVAAGDFEPYDSLVFMVNGINISNKSQAYKVPVYPNTIDTIRYLHKPGAETGVILTRLRPGESYEIVPNGCSTYEIVPKRKHKEICLVRLVTTGKDTTTRYLNSYYCFIDPEQIRTKDTTNYFVNASSGYCPYAVTSFYMCGKDLDHIQNESDTEDCHGVIMHFTGGEMYTLYYNYKTKTMTASFDGYYSKKRNVKITRYD